MREPCSRWGRWFPLQPFFTGEIEMLKTTNYATHYYGARDRMDYLVKSLVERPSRAIQLSARRTLLLR